MAKKKNWVGYKFNTFEVISEDMDRNKKQEYRKQIGEIKNYNKSYLCRCQCGNIVSVLSTQIVKNRPLSCGCVSIE